MLWTDSERESGSWLEAFIAGMSLLSIAVTDEPTGFVRALRALRAISLFGGFLLLRKINSAISLAIVPVLNVVVIPFHLICIGSGSALCRQFHVLRGIATAGWLAPLTRSVDPAAF